MKKSVLNCKIAIVAILFLTISINSCKSTKNVSVKKQGETLIEVYCSGNEYFSDKEYFRANSIGESIDQVISKKKALSNAKQELASSIQTTIKSCTDNYLKSLELNNVEEVEESYEGNNREVVKQKLNGIRTICEKVTKTDEGKYKTYIAIELSGEEILTEMNKRLSKDSKTRIDYDYEKYKKTFDEEMKKLEDEQNY
jgi:hypothetical protein